MFVYEISKFQKEITKYQVIIKSTNRKMDKSSFFKASVIIAVGSSGAALLHELNIFLVSIQETPLLYTVQ